MTWIRNGTRRWAPSFYPKFQKAPKYLSKPDPKSHISTKKLNQPKK
jgi:hypothetical protein